MKSVFSIAGGVITGIIVMVITITISSSLYPIPDSIDQTDVVAMATWIEELPLGAFAVMFTGWFLGAAATVGVARLVSPNNVAPAFLAFLVFSLLSLVGIVSIPMPFWVQLTGGLMLPLGGFVGFGLSTRSSYRVESKHEIKASAESVFDTIADIEKFTQVIPGITGIEFMSEQKNGVGTRFRETRLMNGKEVSTELEVSEMHKPQMIRMVSDAGGTIWDTVFRLEPAEEHVTLQMTMDCKPHQFFATLITPFILPMISTAVDQDLSAVKEFCEAEASE